MAKVIDGRNGGKLKPREKGDPSLNPLGRGKGVLNSKTIIKKWLEAQSKGLNPISNQEEELTHMDQITLQQLAKALKGDTTAFNALLDRLEGKPTQTIAGDNENPLIPAQPLSKEQIDRLIDRL